MVLSIGTAIFRRQFSDTFTNQGRLGHHVAIPWTFHLMKGGVALGIAAVTVAAAISSVVFAVLGGALILASSIAAYYIKTSAILGTYTDATEALEKVEKKLREDIKNLTTEITELKEVVQGFHQLTLDYQELNDRAEGINREKKEALEKWKLIQDKFDHITEKQKQLNKELLSLNIQAGNFDGNSKERFKKMITHLKTATSTLLETVKKNEKEKSLIVDGLTSVLDSLKGELETLGTQSEDLIKDLTTVVNRLDEENDQLEETADDLGENLGKFQRILEEQQAISSLKNGLGGVKDQLIEVKNLFSGDMEKRTKKEILKIINECRGKISNQVDKVDQLLV